MYRREDDVIILYNLITLIYLPLWFISFSINNCEMLLKPYSYLREHNYTDENLIAKIAVFVVIYLIEDILGFKLKFHKYIVITSNLVAFYLLGRLAGYFYLEENKMPVTYWFILIVLTITAFICIFIELNEKLKDYLLSLGNMRWICPMFAGYKYQKVCKKYWRGIFRLAVVAYLFSVIYPIARAAAR